MSGDTTAYKLSTFIKRPSPKATFFKPRFTLVPYNAEQIVSPGDSELQLKRETYEDIVHELVCIGSIPKRAVFPHGLGARGTTDRKRQSIREALDSNGHDKHTGISYSWQ